MPRYINFYVSSGVNIGFTAIMIVPLSVIMCISVYRARRSKDPARVATAYFKAMLPLAILWLLLYMIQGILNIVYNNTYIDGTPVYHASLRTSALGLLFSNTTDLLLIMTLAELGNGFLFCLTQTRTTLQKVVSDRWYSYLDSSLRQASRNMSFAFPVLILVWALLLLVFAAVVFHKTKRNYILKNSAALFLVAAILNLFPRLYTVISLSIFVLAEFYNFNHYETYTAILFVEPVITVWIYTIVVALIFTIVIRKRNGLWTTLQPWMDDQGPPALAANPNAKGPGEQWQQPSNNHVLGA
ncbi:hypothetical protein SLS64_014300 [Diaporthe eres]|uniref:Uncharacterized protein n=1 Tax=Diaporthe eres TaxID=83184 RepID=A0ABR1NS15_DIAER